MSFEVDQRIQDSCVWLAKGRLSSLYLKNDANFPWIILVPHQENVQEIYQLTATNQAMLISEIALVSTTMTSYFKPDKLNVGALGNIVNQLHIHVVARFKNDKAWPHGVWQADLPASFYPPSALEKHVQYLREQIVAGA